MERTALIVGATGLVGGHCLRLLLQRPEYTRVRVLARKGFDLRDSKLDARLVDFEGLPNESEMFVCDDVFCCLGTTIAKAGTQEAFARIDRDYPKMIAERTLRSGALRFLLVSSVGADIDSKNFYLRTKGAVEREIADVPFEAVYIFRPSMLLGERAELRWGEKIAEPIARLLSPIMVNGLRKYRAVEAAFVAQAMVFAALKSKTRGVQVFEYDEMRRLAGASGAGSHSLVAH